MTTDQIRLTETSSGTSNDADELVAAAKSEAKQIVAKARYDAFRMVTDARSEAEAILSEPASEVAHPESTALAEAKAILEDARIQAGRIIEGANAEAANAAEGWLREVEASNAAMLSQHEELEARISKTRAVLEHLEQRLAQIASPPAASSPEPAVTTFPTSFPPRAPRPSNPEPVSQAAETTTDAAVTVAALAAPDPESFRNQTQIDYSPSVARPEPLASVPEPPGGEKGSFYTRRSAKLPRIGESAGRDSVSMSRSMRSLLEKTE